MHRRIALGMIVLSSHFPPDPQAAWRARQDQSPDVLTLARLHRAGELTTIWVPDPGTKPSAIWCVHAKPLWRICAPKRQRVRDPFSYATGGSTPGSGPGRWCTPFGCPASLSSIRRSTWSREYRQAIEDAEARLERLARRVADVLHLVHGPVVEAYQAMRGVRF